MTNNKNPEVSVFRSCAVWCGVRRLAPPSKPLNKRDEPDALRFHTAPHMKKVTAGIGFWHVIGVFWGGGTQKEMTGGRARGQKGLGEEKRK